MQYITETLQTPLGERFDVIVAGGGPAGCCAAIAAARAGARVLLTEQSGCFGGMWTGGLVNPIYDHANKGGLMAEIKQALADRRGFGGFIGSCCHTEDLKALLDEMLTAAGVKLLANTRAAGVMKDGNAVKGLIVENKSGRRAYPADIVIDCTGDGDVCAFAGADTRIGDDETGEVQSFTLMYQLGNVRFMQTDPYTLTNMVKETEARTGKSYDIPFTRSYIIQQPSDDQAVVMLTHMRNLDPLDEEDRTLAMIEGRRQAREMFLYFKENMPQFRDMTFTQTAALLGVRESRRLEGVYTISVEDCLQGRIPEDSVTVATFNVDIHNQKNNDQGYYDVLPYGIPYRSLVPAEVDGLLVAGRCISGCHEAMASYRVTGNCAAMGQAAGCAAALCALEGYVPRALPFERLAEGMRSQNMPIPREIEGREKG